SGEDVGLEAADDGSLKAFIDTRFFDFAYGDADKGERIIDSQMATSTRYAGTTMGGNQTMFGVNFADGRIKGYPIGRTGPRSGRTKTYYVFYVRGNASYGRNDFDDNGDGTITDRATGLVWAKVDSGSLKAGSKQDGRMNWEEALRWCEELEYAGRSDWRLPSAKELQSLVDYTRCPDATGSAAIDPLFQATEIRDAAGQVNWPFYWTSTTHQRMGDGEAAVYVAFGRSQGWMPDAAGEYRLLDVHGAGSQRSDPKAGDPAEFPRGRGPQGDVVAIYNMVRPVRGGVAEPVESAPALAAQRESRRPGGPPREGSRQGFVGRLDRDGDGKVSRQEFDGPPFDFDRLDRDKDGYLGPSEAPLGPPPFGRPFGPPSGPPRPR
ncbi:MAG: Lcl C-terminal domain-containing protein, partial [Thermoguttaceae bacterium]